MRTAVALADAGKRVLLVSTDPASNLDEVLATDLGMHPTPVESVPGLFAMNVDPEEAAKEYRERVVGPYRGVLPEAAVNSIEEQLSGACTVEIAAFDEFAKLLGDSDVTSEFDYVIFDTAPTGHTLRLLQLPAAWSDSSRPMSAELRVWDLWLDCKRNTNCTTTRCAPCATREKTTVYLVTGPESSALAEAERTRQELEALGLRNQRLIVNGVFALRAIADLIAEALESRRLGGDCRNADGTSPAAQRGNPTHADSFDWGGCACEQLAARQAPAALASLVLQRSRFDGASPSGRSDSCSRRPG